MRTYRTHLLLAGTMLACGRHKDGIRHTSADLDEVDCRMCHKANGSGPTRQGRQRQQVMAGLATCYVCGGRLVDHRIGQCREPGTYRP